MPFVEAKILQQKICEEAGIHNTEGSQAGYFTRDMMARLLVCLQNYKEEIGKLKKMIGGDNGAKVK